MRTLPARWTEPLRRRRSTCSRRSDSSCIRATTTRVVAEFARVLKPGGMLIWHGGNRDGVMARFLARDWWLDGRRDDDRPRALVRPAVGHSDGPLDVARPRGRRASASTGSASTRRRASPSCSRRHGLIVEQAFDGWTDRPLARSSRARCCSSPGRTRELSAVAAHVPRWLAFRRTPSGRRRQLMR